MEISDIRIRLVFGKDSKLKAFACVSLDNSFVVRDIRIISRPAGLFVAMPSRKLTFCCARCNGRNHLRAKYCNECGSRLATPHAGLNARGRTKLYADVAHPISAECRELFHRQIIRAYEEELERSRQPGYEATDPSLDGGSFEHWEEAGAETQEDPAEAQQ